MRPSGVFAQCRTERICFVSTRVNVCAVARSLLNDDERFRRPLRAGRFRDSLRKMGDWL